MGPNVTVNEENGLGSIFGGSYPIILLFIENRKYIMTKMVQNTPNYPKTINFLSIDVLHEFLIFFSKIEISKKS